MDDAAFLEVVRERESLSTREVAEVVGCSPRAADHRLRKLYAEGKVESRSVGNTLLWLPATEHRGPTEESTSRL